MRYLKTSTVAVFALLTTLSVGRPDSVHAQQSGVHGQVRPRMEVRDLGGDEDAVAFTSMRVRADFLAALERGVSVFVQLQDVRIWGEETSTLGDFNADNLDLHQGYLRVAFGDDQRLTATVGRQETNLGGQRLVGAVGWTPQARSFDGLRLSSERDWGSLDFLAYQLREGDFGDVPSAALLGVYGVMDVDDRTQLDLYVLYNGVSLPVDTDQATLGARMYGSLARFTYRGEVSLQRGERAGDDVSAFMLGGRVGTDFDEGRGAIAVWYDYLSGDNAPDDGEVRVFDTLFATNHKFYGFADLFLNIPVHTGGLGLQDAAIKSSYAFGEATRVAADIHHFTLAQDGGFPSSTLGQEVDLTLTYRYSANLGVTAGHSLVFADDALLALGRAAGTVHFGYIMLNATF